MSGDQELIGMVNESKTAKENREREAACREELKRIRRQEKRRAFWLGARKALLWILAGAVTLLLMCMGQIAVWLASVITCGCTVAAAIVIDRYVWRWRRG